MHHSRKAMLRAETARSAALTFYNRSRDLLATQLEIFDMLTCSLHHATRESLCGTDSLQPRCGHPLASNGPRAACAPERFGNALLMQ